MSDMIRVNGIDIDTDCDCSLSPSDSDTVMDVPYIYSLELNPICNSRCPGCSNVFIVDKERRKEQKAFGYLNGDEWGAVIKKIAPFARRIKLTGGEPTLHPDFTKIIQQIDELGIRFTLFTNARWLSVTDIMSLFANMSTCNGMLISLHGANAITHEAFTGITGSFLETIENIRCATASGIRVHTSTVITSLNFGEIKEIVHLSEEIGASCAVFNRYLGYSSWQLAPSRKQLMQAVSEVEGVIERGGAVKYGNPIPSTFTKNASLPCAAGLAYCTVDPHGHVRPCNHSPLILGDLLEESICDIWHNDSMSSWRSNSFSRIVSGARNSCHYMAVDLGYGIDPLAISGG